ncbi:MAG: dipeptidase [Halobacteriales archaeon]
MVADTPVFDYFPRGTPFLLSDRMEAAMDEALKAGRGAGGALDAIENEQVRQLEDEPDYRDRLRAAYEAAGVNLVSATMGSLDRTLPFREGVRQDLARWQMRFDTVDWLTKVTTPAQARAVVANDEVGVILNVQNGGAAIDGDVDELDVLYNSGIRIVQLTYNTQNLVGTGCTERVDAGLSNHGVEVVGHLNDRGMVVDLSHCGTQTTLDGIEVSNRPPAVTHAFCRALADHDRGKTDAELKALREADGYMGIVAVPFFLAPGEDDPDFEVFFEHLEHAVDILGIDRVGIGTDWGSWTPELPAPLHEGIAASFASMGFREEHGVTIGEGFGPLQRYEDWPAIKKGLSERGFTDEEIEGILGKNFLAYWERIQ